MRICLATIVGITFASAGFGAGLLGTILVGPWTGTAFPAVTMGCAAGSTAMLLSFTAALRVPVLVRR